MQKQVIRVEAQSGSPLESASETAIITGSASGAGLRAVGRGLAATH